MSAELLLELLEEYTVDQWRRGVPWAERSTVVHAMNIIERDQQEQANASQIR